MRRAVARGQTWWTRLFVLALLADVFLPVPFPVDPLLFVVFLLLAFVRPPASDREPVELGSPVRGRWVALNSPGSKVPSHGVKAYGQAYAVDLLMPDPNAPSSIGWALRSRRPHTYPAFAAPVLAMAPGHVVLATDSQRDHGARDTWPLVAWMLAEGFVRELAGPARILGNHVVVAHADGAYSVYAHLRRGSAAVSPGDQVRRGQQLAQVGNTGNTSEPHLHVQLMDRAHPTAAAGIPMTWSDLYIDPGECDPRWSTGAPKSSAQPGMPANGQVFHAE